MVLSHMIHFLGYNTTVCQIMLFSDMFTVRYILYFTASLVIVQLYITGTSSLGVTVKLSEAYPSRLH